VLMTLLKHHLRRNSVPPALEPKARFRADRRESTGEGVAAGVLEPVSEGADVAESRLVLTHAKA